jgi:hypothetical protein
LYETFVGADGTFDVTGFIGAFRKATNTLVDMEKAIDEVLESVA